MPQTQACRKFIAEVAACTVSISNHEILCKDPCSEKAICLLRNPRKATIDQITVDGCIRSIADIPKCDFAFVKGSKRVWYIELKGSDYEHAITQLKNTLEIFKTHHAAKTKKECVLVGTRVPAAGPETQEIKKEFHRLGAKFTPLTTPAELTIS